VDLGIAGRRAVVAAASRGLGFATAAALAAEGVTVAIGSRSRDAIDRAAESIGANAVPLVADVATVDGAIAFARAARDALGTVDILVANAGGPPAGNFATTDLGEYARAVELNCLSVIAMCTEVVPAMQEQGWGRVLAITSIAVRQPIANLILSNTARTGVTGFLKTLAREVAHDGVTVNSIQPGMHGTDRVRHLYGDGLASVAEGIPAGALGEPDDFGRVAAFLCSEPARFVTGTAVLVDGGQYAGLM
jgi:3-oxoacyl-[acyl-carrier protein] reductase